MTEKKWATKNAVDWLSSSSWSSCFFKIKYVFFNV